MDGSIRSHLPPDAVAGAPGERSRAKMGGALRPSRDPWNSKPKARSERKRDPQTGSAKGNAATPTPSRIGPNSVIQSLEAVEALEGVDARAAVARATGWAERALPTAMIPEAEFVAMVAAIRGHLPPSRAEAVLREAGYRTATYVKTHRVPGVVRAVLPYLPTRVGLGLLLWMFQKHAWTFAGSGAFRAEGAYPGRIVLEGCPSCRPDADPPAGLRAGAYYEAAFEGLLRLAHPHIRVEETQCHPGRACTFALHVPAKDDS